MKKYTPIDTREVKTYSIKTRNNKVNIEEHFAGSVAPGLSVRSLLDTMPALLGAEALRAVAGKMVAAREQGRPVVLAMGGHVIKCGLQPVLKSLIEADVITAVAMNGSAAIHDFEVSLIGATSEDVGEALHCGDFGFSDETGAGMNRALKAGLDKEIGFARAVGEWILQHQHPYQQYSLLATCVESGYRVRTMPVIDPRTVEESGANLRARVSGLTCVFLDQVGYEYVPGSTLVAPTTGKTGNWNLYIRMIPCGGMEPGDGDGAIVKSLRLVE